VGGVHKLFAQGGPELHICLSVFSTQLLATQPSCSVFFSLAGLKKATLLCDP